MLYRFLASEGGLRKIPADCDTFFRLKCAGGFEAAITLILGSEIEALETWQDSSLSSNIAN